ncbi:MAG TPA: hypothetical protein V6C58_05890 [Allocoleopsis sp.]
MTIYIASSIPNAWFPESSKLAMISTSIDLPEVVSLLCDADHYASYSDNITPLKLKNGVVSCVGHRTIADIMSDKLWEYTPAYDDYGRPIKPAIPISKKEIVPKDGDVIIALIAIIKGGSRIAKKGEIFTPPLRWVKCVFQEVKDDVTHI